MNYAAVAVTHGFQDGTISPDIRYFAHAEYCPGCASGDAAVVYSVSSASVHPGISAVMV